METIQTSLVLVDKVTTTLVKITETIENSMTTCFEFIEVVEEVSTSFVEITEVVEESVEVCSDFVEVVDEAGEAVERTGNKMDTFKKGLDFVEKLKEDVDTVRDAFNDAIEPGVRFQEAMAGLQATFGLTDEKTDWLSDKVRGLSKTFGVDATEGVGMFKDLLSQLSPELLNYPEVLDAMGNNVMTLSKVMGGDVKGATDALASSFKEFGLSVEDPVKAAKEMEEQMNAIVRMKQPGGAEAQGGGDNSSAIDASTSAVDRAAIVMDSYAEKQKRAKAFMDDLKISFFNLTEPIAPFINGAGDLVDKLVTLGTAAWSVAQIMSIGAVKSSFAWIGSMAKMVFSTVTSATAMTAAISSIPIVGWIAIAITAVGALVIYLWNKFGEVRGFFYGLWNFIKVLFTEYYTFIFNVMQAIVQVINPANWFDKDFSFGDVFDKLAQQAVDGGERVGNAFSDGYKDGMASWEKDHPKEGEGEPGGQTEGAQVGGLQIGKGGNPKVIFPSGFDPANSPVANAGDSALPKALTTLPGQGGGSDGGKVRNVTMNVTMNNNFSVSSGNDIREIVNQVKRELIAVMTDVVPAIG